MISCNQMSADYLFQRDKHYDVSYDTGDKVIQCGRHNDIFKFWLMWRARVSERLPKTVVLSFYPYRPYRMIKHRIECRVIK